jgi:hypothetical protein
VVALIPQEERLDESNIQILPPGFHVVYLPYSGKQVAYMLCVFFHSKIYAVSFKFYDMETSTILIQRAKLLKKLCFFFTSKMCSPAMCELSQLP